MLTGFRADVANGLTADAQAESVILFWPKNLPSSNHKQIQSVAPSYWERDRVASQQVHIFPPTCRCMMPYIFIAISVVGFLYRAVR